MKIFSEKLLTLLEQVRRILGISKAEEREKGSDVYRNNSWEFSRSGEGTKCTHPQRYNRTHKCFNAKDRLQHTCIKTVKSQWTKRLPWWCSKQESACQGGNRYWGWCLVWKDSTCHKVTKPGHHNYWACTVEPVLCSKRGHHSEE